MGIQYKSDSIRESKIKSLESEIAKSDSCLTECIEALVQNKMDVLYPGVLELRKNIRNKITALLPEPADEPVVDNDKKLQAQLKLQLEDIDHESGAGRSFRKAAMDFGVMLTAFRKVAMDFGEVTRVLGESNPELAAEFDPKENADLQTIIQYDPIGNEDLKRIIEWENKAEGIRNQLRPLLAPIDEEEEGEE